MLWTLAVVLIILWLLGLMTSYTLGGSLSCCSSSPVVACDARDDCTEIDP